MQQNSKKLVINLFNIEEIDFTKKEQKIKR